jgi:microcystin-dependent protein
MSSPYVGEVRMFAGNFAPAGWALCDGSLIAISENTTLFNLIGTTYGGDGQSTFAVPDLRSRIPIHQGQGSGLSNYVIGANGGVETVTLTVNQIPGHSHPIIAENAVASTTATDPTNHLYGNGGTTELYSLHTGALSTMMQSASAGGNQPHTNVQPVLAINYIIALFGIYPSPT